MLYDAHGVSKGFAFITFTHPGDAYRVYQDGLQPSTGKSYYKIHGTVLECKITDPANKQVSQHIRGGYQQVNNNNNKIKPYLYSALQNISRRFTIKVQDII